MKGEIGIWIGTIMALRKFLDSNFDILVLFEDDIISSKDGVCIANTYLLDKWKSFDIFALYTPENQYYIYGRKRHIRAYIAKHFFDKPELPTRLYQHWSVASYAISRIGAEKLLRSIEMEIVVPVDWHIFRGNFRSLSFKPNGPKPFTLANLASTIQLDREQN
jgi:GR25 family glycosyltransferase involved in LPS biosynthesis